MIIQPQTGESIEKSIQPSQQEVHKVLQQLREIPCTPKFRLNSEIHDNSQALLAKRAGCVDALLRLVVDITLIIWSPTFKAVFATGLPSRIVDCFIH
ncbi:hypothetical protein H6G97_34365 [Nostoc flagelliforme FACHB-838]|uniref:Uncharacterized protein n=1 Tax=Nostoc flagelliforme FACHB-838 TaxID=2692904 RepID=A0ABR8DY29_9NOSO|nr:hypothetical protein [Nostoc flagelliforme]MBD2534331.1 hypothetical protein [Nostoc flagelliforme FACHB-838]